MKRMFALAAALLMGTLAATYSGQVGPYGVTITEPTAPPTVPPTAPPTPVVTPTPLPVTGWSYPSAGWPQWTSANIMTQRLDSHNPASHVASWSASAISYYNSSGFAMGSWQSYDPLRIGNSGDAGTNTYLASNSDPTHVIHCTTYACPGLEGLAIHIPNNAVVEQATADSGSDKHMLLIDPTGRYIYELYQASTVLANGNVTSGAIFDTYFSTAWIRAGEKSGANDEAYVSIVSGEVTAKDLLQGSINHAMLIGAPCEGPTAWVYPTVYSGPFDRPCNGGTGAPLGARLWLNMTDAQINAAGLDPVKTIVAKGLAHYGAFLHDSTGTSSWLLRRSGAGSGQGATDWQAAINMYGSVLTSGSWLSDNWPSSISTHFQWLDPCMSLPVGQTVGSVRGCY